MLPDWSEALYDRNAGTIALSLLAVMLLAAEVGFRVGRHDRTRGAIASHSQVAAIQAAVLGLLGLLLAFSFSFAEARFDARKQVLVEEANAIGTAYLRASLLEDPDRAVVESTLRSYLDARLAFYRTSYDDAVGLASARERARALELAAWARVAALGRAQPRATTVALLLHALNAVIDLHAKQDMAFAYRVPGSIIFLLFALSILSMGVVGYGNGATQRRQRRLTLALILVSALVLYVIMDLDRPRRGFIRVGGTSLAGLGDAIPREP
jgi:hypothetical protein